MSNPYVGPVAVNPSLPGGNKWYPNIAAATVVKTGVGIIAKVSVTTAGSTVGAVYDSASTTGNSVSNQIGVIPNTVGVYLFDWPCGTGIVIAPGTSQVVAVSFT